VTRIMLHIDHVVVEGMALTPHDAETLRRSLEAELGVQLRRQIAGAARRGGSEAVSALLGNHRAPTITGTGNARLTGEAAAQSLANALRPLLASPRAAAAGDGGKNAGMRHG